MPATTSWTDPATSLLKTLLSYCSTTPRSIKLSQPSLLPSTITSSLSYVSDKMHTLKLYDELMDYATHSSHKVRLNQYLEQNSTTLSLHLLEDLQLIQANQGCWTQQGNLDMETNLKEIKDALQRLQESYTGISTFLTEMSRWCSEDRQIPPCFSHFYHGPDNSVVLSALIGYQTLGTKKQHQLRLGLLELDIISQYVITAAGHIRTCEHPGPILDAFLSSMRIPGTKWGKVNRI